MAISKFKVVHGLCVAILTVSASFTSTASAWGTATIDKYSYSLSFYVPALLPEDLVVPVPAKQNGAIERKLTKFTAKPVPHAHRAGCKHEWWSGAVAHNPRHGRTRHWQAMNKKLLSGAGGQPLGAERA